jgi:hypothetical protein
LYRLTFQQENKTKFLEVRITVYKILIHVTLFSVNEILGEIKQNFQKFQDAIALQYMHPLHMDGIHRVTVTFVKFLFLFQNTVQCGPTK